MENKDANWKSELKEGGHQTGKQQGTHKVAE
jgi:hypothetical protein